MKQTILNTFERTTRSGKFREEGYTPGVLYGDNITKTTSIKFKTSDITKILTTHGSNAKLWVKYGDKKTFGFIKEVQRDPISRQVKHIDIHLVSQNQEVKMQIPIIFKGKENLEHRILTLQVFKSEVEVLGKTALMPDSIIVDVSEKNLGDTITVCDLGLDKQLKSTDKENEVYGTILSLRVQPIEEPAEKPAREPAKEAAGEAAEEA